MRKRGAIGLTLIFIQEVGGVVAGFFLSNSSKERGQTMLHVLHGGAHLSFGHILVADGRRASSDAGSICGERLASGSGEVLLVGCCTLDATILRQRDR